MNGREDLSPRANAEEASEASFWQVGAYADVGPVMGSGGEASDLLSFTPSTFDESAEFSAQDLPQSDPDLDANRIGTVFRERGSESLSLADYAGSFSTQPEYENSPGIPVPASPAEIGSESRSLSNSHSSLSAPIQSQPERVDDAPSPQSASSSSSHTAESKTSHRKRPRTAASSGATEGATRPKRRRAAAPAEINSEPTAADKSRDTIIVEQLKKLIDAEGIILNLNRAPKKDPVPLTALTVFSIVESLSSQYADLKALIPFFRWLLTHIHSRHLIIKMLIAVEKLSGDCQKISHYRNKYSRDGRMFPEEKSNLFNALISLCLKKPAAIELIKDISQLSRKPPGRNASSDLTPQPTSVSAPSPSFQQAAPAAAKPPLSTTSSTASTLQALQAAPCNPQPPQAEPLAQQLALVGQINALRLAQLNEQLTLLAATTLTPLQILQANQQALLLQALLSPGISLPLQAAPAIAPFFIPPAQTYYSPLQFLNGRTPGPLANPTPAPYSALLPETKP